MFSSLNPVPRYTLWWTQSLNKYVLYGINFFATGLSIIDAMLLGPGYESREGFVLSKGVKKLHYKYDVIYGQRSKLDWERLTRRVDCILPFSLYSQAEVKVKTLFVQKLFTNDVNSLKKKYYKNTF